jgi:hypothetical protein
MLFADLHQPAIEAVGTLKRLKPFVQRNAAPGKLDVSREGVENLIRPDELKLGGVGTGLRRRRDQFPCPG